MTPLFYDRHLAEIDFIRRIVTESSRHCHPLLERLRFLAHAASGLDGFAMLRLGRAKLVAGPETQGPEWAGQDEVRAAAQDLADLQQETWRGLRRDLTVAGIAVLDHREWTRRETAWLTSHALAALMPMLTPVAVDPSHPFPRLRALDKAVALDLICRATGVPRLVIIRLPEQLDRFVTLPDVYQRGTRIVAPVEQAICAAAEQLFEGHVVRSSGLFRVLRDGALDTGSETDDMTRQVARGLRRRAQNRPVLMDVEDGLAAGAIQVLRRSLGLKVRDVNRTGGFIGLRDLAAIAAWDVPALRYPRFVSRRPAVLPSPKSDVFGVLKQRDILLHHPYDSFDVVVDFLRQAARDPDVVTLRQTLYRTSPESPVVAALCEAAEGGKSVTVLVELKARFDEEANLRWSRQLARSGVQVVHGVESLKMHAKLSLVVRREADGLATYCHFGTGNYNPATADSYSDLSLLTADPTLGRDATRIFHFATGYCDPHALEEIAVSPSGLRQVLLARIDDEARHARAGRPARIWLKCNALTDPSLIEALYAASAAGVAIDLMIRGACSLRPGLPGLSETIRVRSLVGRFLEHARVYAFGSGWGLPHPRGALFISSADLMPRNLDRRLETLVPVRDPGAHERIMSIILPTTLADNAQSWRMLPDGSSTRIEVQAGEAAVHAQDMFMRGHESPLRRGAVPSRVSAADATSAVRTLRIASR